MTVININIPDEQLQQLQAMAQTNGISTEELLRTTIEDWLNYPKSDFEQAAKYVLKKNRTYVTGTNRGRDVALARNNLTQTKHIGRLGRFSC
jgi:hypothetical protein